MTNKWLEWIKKTTKLIASIITLITAIIGFTVLIRTEGKTVVVITSTIILLAAFFASVFVIISKTKPLLFEGKGVIRYPRLRPWAIVIAIVIVFIFTAILIWKPSRQIIKHVIYGTPTAIEITNPNLDIIEVPYMESSAISVALTPGSLWHWVSLVTREIDRNNLIQVIDPDTMISPGDVSPRFGSIGLPSTIWLNITGRSEDEPVQITNRIPIQLLSYEPIPETVDLVTIPVGGGMDAWLLEARMSPQVEHRPNQITWATYNPDIRDHIAELYAELPDFQYFEYPKEMSEAVLSGSDTIPDYFVLSNNERLVISVAMYFEKPGIYTLKYGVEHLIGNKLAIAWAKPGIKVYIPENYYLWATTYSEDPNEYYLWNMCNTNENLEHICSEICSFSINGIQCSE